MGNVVIENCIEKSYYRGDNGGLICIKKDTRKWDIYVLFYMGKPIYAGQTTNLKLRINEHKCTGRLFDSYMIANTVYTDEQARIAEHTIIGYLKIMYPDLQNKNSVKFGSEIVIL